MGTQDRHTNRHAHTHCIVSARHCMKYSSSTLSKATTRTRGPVKRRFYCSLFLSLSPFWFYFHQRAWHSQSVRARRLFKPPTDNTRKSAHKSLTHTRTHAHTYTHTDAGSRPQRTVENKQKSRQSAHSRKGEQFLIELRVLFCCGGAYFCCVCMRMCVCVRVSTPGDNHTEGRLIFPAGMTTAAQTEVLHQI